MPDIHILIDSTANITEDYTAKHPSLHIVPLKVMLEGREWAEDELSPAELFALVEQTGGIPRTSQPSAGDFLTVLEPLVQDGHEIIVITLAGALSGTAQGAGTVARMLNSSAIHIIDSGTTAIGMVYLAEAALQMADSGSTAAAIAVKLQQMAKTIHTLFVPGMLEYLHKGGRIGGAAALFGSILQIKPILHLVDGKVAVLDKVRTRSRAIARMTAELEQYGRPARIGIVENGALAEAEALSSQIRELYPYSDISVSGIGSVLGAHLGPGLIGLIFQENDNQG